MFIYKGLIKIISPLFLCGAMKHLHDSCSCMV